MIEHHYWDRVTGTPCDLIWDDENYNWVMLEGKTRPRTRRSDEVITMAAREKMVADIAKRAAENARFTTFIPSIHKDAEVVRLERIVELLDNTIKWLVTSGNIPLIKDYLTTPPSVEGINPQYTKIAVPAWVDDVIKVAANS